MKNRLDQSGKDNSKIYSDNENSNEIKDKIDKIKIDKFNNCNNLTFNIKQKNKFEREKVFDFRYINKSSYEKLENENKLLIEAMKNLEKRYQKEKSILKEEITRLNSKRENKNEISKDFNKNFNRDKEVAINKNNNEELQKILNNKEKEISDYKLKIQQYKNYINLIGEDFEKKKNQLEKDIPQLHLKIKKYENDLEEIKKELENEKNKNMINNIIINEKKKEIDNFNEFFKLINIYKEKIIKNGIDNDIKFNFENKLTNNNENEYINNYGRIGIVNNGFNCYMSSVIQILKNIKKFSPNILNYNEDDIITNTLRKLLNNLYYSKEKYTSINEFKKDFGLVYNKFSEEKQNDSTIFLMYLLQHLNKVFKRPKNLISNIYLFKNVHILNLSEENELEKFLNKYEAKNNSYIHDLFFGYQMNKIICSKCENTKSSFQSFIILDLPLINENIKVRSLEQSLNSYLFTKDKQNVNGFECPNCGEKYLSFITYIIKLPKILVINLKRVGEDTVYYHEISIPYILKTKLIEKLSPHDSQYELIGFIKHFGNEKGGHNISFAKNIFDNKWYSFNDTIVKEEKQFPSTDKTFLLFYQIIE